MRNSDISLSQNVFQDNSAYHGGTLLYAHKSSRIMATNNTFLNNIAKEGGAIYVRIAVPSSQRTHLIKNNSANEGGSLNYTRNSIPNLTFSE